MNRFDAYLYQILNGTYLHKQEKVAWIEEMQSHLEDSVQHYRVAGLSDEQAHQRALASFGTAKELRQQIIRETFVISPKWYLIVGVLCFISLGVALFTNTRFDDSVVTIGNPATWEPIPTPQWVVWLHQHFPLNPARWATLGTMSFMMVFTRKQTDRLAVLISWIPFSVSLLPSSVSLPLGSDGIRQVIFSALPIIQPVSIGATCEYGIIFALGIALYIWTRNRIISLTPWMISITLTVAPFLWSLMQETLWEQTRNPIFWGLAPVSWGYLWSAISSVIVYLIGAVLLLFMCKRVESSSIRLRKLI